MRINTNHPMAAAEKWLLIATFQLMSFAACVGLETEPETSASPNPVPTFACPQRSSDAASVALPAVEHVFIVVLENADADQALQQPFLKGLAQHGAYLSNFHGLTHPSEPNYIAMVGGDTFSAGSNDEPVSLSQTNLADLIESAGKTWKVYAEDYPGNCFLGAEAGKFVRHHVPFLAFSNVIDNPARCSKVVNSSELQSDIQNGNLPNLAFYIPNQTNNGHSSGVGVADTWLSQTFGGLMNDPRFMTNTLFIVTFDESATSPQNQIYLSLSGQYVNPGTTNNACYTHYDLLRTVEGVLRLPTLGRQDESGVPFQGIWH